MKTIGLNTHLYHTAQGNGSPTLNMALPGASIIACMEGSCSLWHEESKVRTPFGQSGQHSSLCSPWVSPSGVGIRGVEDVPHRR